MKYDDLPQGAMEIMQYVENKGRITTSDAENLLPDISRPTIKNRLALLLKKELLVRHGKGRGTWYSKAD